jgi:hypothetical protein
MWAVAVSPVHCTRMLRPANGRYGKYRLALALFSGSMTE